MELAYVSLLKLQHELYQLPRGFERFQEYLRAMIDAHTGDLQLPLAAMNPMGKEHVTRFLAQLLEMGADDIAASAIIELRERLLPEAGTYRVCMVVSDDLKGGWTNRYAAEFGYYFEQQAYYKRGWLAALLWTSEQYTAASLREEVRACVYRAVYVQRHGAARTLREMLAQEGYVRCHAGATTPALAPEDLDYTKAVVEPYFVATDRATQVAALFGDAAARDLGYSPLGLSPRAGLALALAEANAAQ